MSTKAGPALTFENERIYVRVKRERTIYFLECFSTDSIDAVKRTLQHFLKAELTDFRLYLQDRLLDDRSNIHDQDVKNDSVLILVLKKTCALLTSRIVGGARPPFLTHANTFYTYIYIRMHILAYTTYIYIYFTFYSFYSLYISSSLCIITL
jgi:hypothetical protein